MSVVSEQAAKVRQLKASLAAVDRRLREIEKQQKALSREKSILNNRSFEERRQLQWAREKFHKLCDEEHAL